MAMLYALFRTCAGTCCSANLPAVADVSTLLKIKRLPALTLGDGVGQDGIGRCDTAE